MRNFDDDLDPGQSGDGDPVGLVRAKASEVIARTTALVIERQREVLDAPRRIVEAQRAQLLEELLAR